ncbi:MAG: nematoblast specific protein [Pseudopedobacter saltans]|uniref:Nematoblast specific protein n=1 Tax=Pseudopedobacter saltans TaxID=151895 RepID=A0A2W5F6A1_9SPHI|nr:MAG: nematoblast specific protein [Pseudopedobacter saltans]
MRKKLPFATLFLILIFNLHAQIAIPTAGNTYQTPISNNGRFNGNIARWKDTQKKFTTFFRIQNKGKLNIAFHTKSSGTSNISATLEKSSKTISIKNTDWEKIALGTWEIKDTGYQSLQLTLLSSKASVDIDTIYIEGPSVKGDLVFVPNNEDNFYYWGRRGPSVHLNYATPKEKNIEWFYNEVTVPIGSDPIGSYYMADGFNVGYFGFQVNSTDTRHILFSVWSPFSTDNPKDIPADKKITLLKKGENVHAGEFGNEGSGGQSYLNYMWKPGNTYKFLLHGKPNSDSTTDFTAYFYAPELQKWILIASFKRPKTFTWLKGLHSFLENFDPEMGNVSRIAHYGNQWVCTADGEWLPLDKARFTIDNTGRKNYRKDYAGGVENNQFFLKNGGFFSNFTPADSPFSRTSLGNQKPDIDFSKLP